LSHHLKENVMSRNHLCTGALLALLLTAVALAADKPGEKPEKEAAGHENVAIPKEGVAVLTPTEGNDVRGVILLSQMKDGVRVRGEVSGLTPGKHGFHIHEYGDLRSPDGESAGGHFNPEGVKHGGPDHDERHAGDLGNITANSQGVAKVDMLAKGLKLHFVVGRAIVVHDDEDDLTSQPSGDAGPRVALGVIGYAGRAQDKTKRAATR
jgi:superoxide dismutase, Cu-Zn family